MEVATTTAISLSTRKRDRALSWLFCLFRHRRRCLHRTATVPPNYRYPICVPFVWRNIAREKPSCGPWTRIANTHSIETVWRVISSRWKQKTPTRVRVADKTSFSRAARTTAEKTAASTRDARSDNSPFTNIAQKNDFSTTIDFFFVLCCLTFLLREKYFEGRTDEFKKNRTWYFFFCYGNYRRKVPSACDIHTCAEPSEVSHRSPLVGYHSYPTVRAVGFCT